MLPSSDRLRASRCFARVFAGGQSFADGLLVLHVLAVEGDERAIGFSTSKKLGNAIARNLVKRRLREATRALLPTWGRGYWLVVVARGRAAQAPQAALSRSLATLATRAGLACAPAPPPP